MKGWASCDLPALVITKIPTETGEVIDWLWNGGTVTIKWFCNTVDMQKDNESWNITQHLRLTLFKQKHKSIHKRLLNLPDGKGPCQSLPRLARNYHLQIEQKYLFFLPSTRRFKCRHMYPHKY